MGVLVHTAAAERGYRELLSLGGKPVRAIQLSVGLRAAGEPRHGFDRLRRVAALGAARGHERLGAGVIVRRGRGAHLGDKGHGPRRLGG